jgi:hypothetical protein
MAPDSGWVSALKEAGPPFFGVVLAVCLGLSLIWRYVLEEPAAGAIAWVDAIAVACALVLAAQGLWHLVKGPRKMPGALDTWLMCRRYAKLNKQQRQLLRQAFQSGTRRFEMYETKMRWFEELSERGFVRYVPQLIVVLGSHQPTPYEVTQRAWRALESLERRNKL